MSQVGARQKKKDIRAESSRKFNKIPQKTIVDSEKLQNYKIHQRNEKELLYLAKGRGNKSSGPHFQMGCLRLRDLGSVSMEGSWYTLPQARPNEDSLSSGEFPI